MLLTCVHSSGVVERSSVIGSLESGPTWVKGTAPKNIERLCVEHSLRKSLVGVDLERLRQWFQGFAERRVLTDVQFWVHEELLYE